MSTVAEVLNIADQLRTLHEEERRIEGVISASASKADRLTQELNGVRGRIASTKAQLKNAAKDME